MSGSRVMPPPGAAFADPPGLGYTPGFPLAFAAARVIGLAAGQRTGP